MICDASGDGIGAALFQNKQVIAFEGRKYRPAECNYTVGEQELLAVVHALHVWRCYLEGAPRFKVITDHNPLVYINTQQHLSRRQSRWVEFMQRFDIEWQYRPGRFNVADPLSRAPSLVTQPPSSLHDDVALFTIAAPVAAAHRTFARIHANACRHTCAAQATSLLLLTLPFAPRLTTQPGGKASSILTLLTQTVRRSPRHQKELPHEADASVPRRRSPVWAAEPTESSPVRGNATGSAIQMDVAPCIDNHSTSSSPRSEANGLTAPEPEPEPAANLSEQLSADEELAGLVVDFLDDVRAGYKHDQHFNSDNFAEFAQSDGLYWGQHQLVIPDYKRLRQRCLEVTHDAPWAGHFGRDKTSMLVTSLYWWPGIHKDVAEYIRTCPACQRAKSKTHKPYGLMVPLQVPQRRWTSIGIDFITHLPITTTGFDAIAVFVDRLSKRVHLAPCHDTTIRRLLQGRSRPCDRRRRSWLMLRL